MWFSLLILYSVSIRVIPYICIPLHFYCWRVFHWMDMPQFAYPFPVTGHLEYFYSLAIMNSAAGNIHIQVFVWACFYFLWESDLSGISGWCGKFMFNFLRNYQNSCTVLHFTVNAWGIFFSHPCHFDYSLSSGCEIICNYGLNFSLITSEVGCLVMC